MAFVYEDYKKSADFILEKIGDFKPEIGIVLGSGLGGFSNCIENPIEIPYGSIPNFPVSTAPGHAGKFIFGTVSGRRLMCMSGRFHHYEGYSENILTMPVRVMKLCGIKELILTNAAGAVNKDYGIGDIMILKDHINIFGVSPMRGPYIEEFGERFFDVSDMYSKDLRDIAKEAAKESELTFREGVYFFAPGPMFETPAEIRAERILGADACGMSTVTEALTAAHCGIPVLAFSLISNMAAGVSEVPLSADDVLETGKKVGPLFEKYIVDLLRRLP